MSTLMEHARRELELSGQAAEDRAFAESLTQAIEKFAEYRHSGGSAEVGIEMLHKLLRREPLTPLTSDASEWEDRSAESGTPWWQNVRDSRAMSHDGGKTWWYVDARYPGERCKDGGEDGVLVGCRECHGSGVLHRPDSVDQPGPQPQEGTGA